MQSHRFSPRSTARSIVRFAAAISFAVGAAGVQAQAVMVYGEGETPSAQDVADILSRGASENVRTRGITAQPGRASPFSQLEQVKTSKVEEASAVSVPVHFEFDSAVLSAKAKQQLKVIAEGIRLTDGTIRIVVEGHTDAKGSVKYNEALSVRRAASVRAYLIEVANLPVKLLTVEGKGPHKPLDKSDPFNAVNRRVQFRAG